MSLKKNTRSNWIIHVKKYQNKHNCSYKEALKEAKKTYKQKQKGKGILTNVKDAISGADDPRGTPSIRKLLDTYGDYKITQIQVCKKPIMSIFRAIGNIITFGDLNRYLKSKNYDDLYHLYIVLSLSNGTKLLYKIDKNARVDASKIIPSWTEDSTCTGIIKTNILVKDLISKTMSRMGKSFFIYNAKSTNCQHFVTNVLQANNLFNPKLNSFINQNIEDLFEDHPIIEKVIKKITDIGKSASILIEGKGYS